MRFSFFAVVAVVILGGSCTPPAQQMGCNASNCSGCCDSSNKCVSGVETVACGRGGLSCVSCPFSFSCVVGTCTPGGTGGGTVVTGGGTTTAGGTTAGGTAGSSGGGSTGGGSTSGGPGGGATGGGTSGGTVVISCTTGCVTPPGARCSNANTLVTPQANGTCINSQCVFSETQTACPYGCVNNACAVASTCTPNARRCNGTQIQTCNSNGSAWLFAQNCTGTCTNGLCDAPCTPSARRCNGGTVETCNTAGSAWGSPMACAQGCLAGACLTDVLEVTSPVTMDGEYHFSQRLTVRIGGRLQVTAGKKLTIYAPTILVDDSSSITGTGSSSGTCEAGPDDVFQGIKLVANQVTVNGSVSWTGGCSKNGVVIRAGTIDGTGTITSNARSLLLFGSGGVAPGLTATGATKSLMPPEVITSSNYPEGGLYNDDGPPPVFTWSKPASNITGYYYTVGQGPQRPTATSSFLAVEALALRDSPAVGPTYLDVVSIDSTGTIGTVAHEFVVNVQGTPPALSSPTNPTPGMYSPNPTVVVAWDGGNPTVGYYRVFDRYPTTRPTPQTGTFEPTNKSPAQTLLQNVADGRWWFHMIALDSMGYATKSAAHYEIDIGAPGDAGTIAGRVTDPTDAGIIGATVVVQRGLYVTTTTAGGVYTFGNLIPAGSYEVVAKDERPDAGRLQAKAAMVTVTPAMTSEVNFALAAGIGCPTCSDSCAGVACGAPSSFCPNLASTGTCQAGTCVSDSSFRTASVGMTRSSTIGMPDNHFFRYVNGSRYWEYGGDIVFAFTAPTTKTYSFSFQHDPNDPNASLGVYLTYTPPCTAQVAYSSNLTWGSLNTSASVTMSAGSTLFIVIDSYQGGEGAFTMTIN